MCVCVCVYIYISLKFYNVGIGPIPSQIFTRPYYLCNSRLQSSPTWCGVVYVATNISAQPVPLSRVEETSGQKMGGRICAKSWNLLPRLHSNTYRNTVILMPPTGRTPKTYIVVCSSAEVTYREKWQYFGGIKRIVPIPSFSTCGPFCTCTR